MSILSDRGIKAALQGAYIGIDPYDEALLQPASYDLRLDNIFKVMSDGVTDPRQEKEYHTRVVSDTEPFRLHGLQFCLASTIEVVRFSDAVVGRLEGKSSLGRLGLTAHVTAGFFDPGFEGHATLELFNASMSPILLWPGMKICQMSFHRLTSPSERPYGHEDLGSKYQQQQRGPHGSQMHRNFDDEASPMITFPNTVGSGPGSSDG